MAEEKSDVVEQGVREFLQMRQELASLRETLSELQTEYDNEKHRWGTTNEFNQMEIAQLKERLRQAEAERDHARSQMTEVATLFSVMQTALDKSKDIARMGAFRPASVSRVNHDGDEEKQADPASLKMFGGGDKASAAIAGSKSR